MQVDNNISGTAAYTGDAYIDDAKALANKKGVVKAKDLCRKYGEGINEYIKSNKMTIWEAAAVIQEFEAGPIREAEQEIESTRRQEEANRKQREQLEEYEQQWEKERDKLLNGGHIPHGL